MHDNVPSTGITGVLELHLTSRGLSVAVGKNEGNFGYYLPFGRMKIACASQAPDLDT